MYAEVFVGAPRYHVLSPGPQVRHGTKCGLCRGSGTEKTALTGLCLDKVYADAVGHGRVWQSGCVTPGMLSGWKFMQMQWVMGGCGRADVFHSVCFLNGFWVSSGLCLLDRQAVCIVTCVHRAQERAVSSGRAQGQ